MRPTRVLAVLALVLAITACSDDTETDASPTTTQAATTTSTLPSDITMSAAGPSTTSTATTQPPTEQPPTDTCDSTATLAVIDAAITAARLAPGSAWSTDETTEAAVAASPYAERTTDADEYATRLGLDCGIAAIQSTDDGGERLVLAAWTGDRAGFIVQASDEPSTPYAAQATVSVGIDFGQGEFVDGDTQAIWAGTLDAGTFVVGHADHALGAVAKGWTAGDWEFEDFTSLDSERHAIAALEEADMRNISIAEPPMFGSEEGYVQFTSPAGQLLVADVAPTDWFDPMTPRYYSGETTTETIAGVEVRMTSPTPEDNLGFTRGAEWGWACADFVWILQPPFNGDAAEMRLSVEAIVATDVCGATS